MWASDTVKYQNYQEVGSFCGGPKSWFNAGSLSVLCLCAITSPSPLSDLRVWQKLCWIGSKQKQLRKWASGVDLQRGFSTNQRRLDGTRSAVHCQDPAPLLLAQAAQGLACLQKSYTSHSYKHKHAQIHTNSADTVLWISNAQHKSIKGSLGLYLSHGWVVTRALSQQV